MLNFEVICYKTSDDCDKILYDVKTFVTKKLRGATDCVTVEVKDDKRYFKDLQSNLWFFDGIVCKRKLKQENVFDLLYSYCNEQSLNNTLIAFDNRHVEKFPFFRAKFHSIHESDLYSCELGTLSKLNQFVSHVEIGENSRDLEPEAIQLVIDGFERKIWIDIYKSQWLRLGVDFTSINRIILSKNSETWFVYLAVSTPPLLYEVHNKTRDNEQRKCHLTEGEWQDIMHSTSAILRKATFSADFEAERITKSNVIRLHPECVSDLEIDIFAHIWTLASNIHRYAGVPIYIGNIDKSKYIDVNALLPRPRNLPFNVYYAFECLQFSFQLHDQLNLGKNDTATFIRMIEKYSKLNSKATEAALYDLYTIIHKNIPVDSIFTLKNLFATRILFSEEQTEQATIVQIRECVLTPSRIVFQPPSPCIESQTIRSSDADFVLRVYAKDENFEPLNILQWGHASKFIGSRFHAILTHGIEIDDRVYKFIGSSARTTQELSMIFYAKDNNSKTAENFREELGHSILSKNCLKWGLSGQPIAIMPDFPKECVLVEEDVKGGINPVTDERSVTSEGFGKISRNLALKLTSLVDKDRNTPFSAFEIKYGAVKGIVVCDPNLSGMKMVVRESMFKFFSKSTSIEIIKVSKPRNACLNRSFINILNQLGVKSCVFLSTVHENLQELIDVHSCRCKALDIIRKHSTLELDFGFLKESAVDIFKEEFFTRILDIVVNNAVNEIKDEGLIKISNEKGRTMFGILDETGILNEGEVFVEYSQMDGSKSCKVIIGEVVIMKNPCMHPGDVRKFKAVDIPTLRHICDCVVFSQQSARFNFYEMSGSDYVVIWDQSFVFPGKNEQAVQYFSPKDKAIKSHFEVDQILHLNTVRKSNLEVISNRHFSFSDYSLDGIFDKRCLTLAKQYLLALDSAKSGNIVVHPKYRPIYYPDFMEKFETKPTYKSMRALGKIFRLSCLFAEIRDTGNIANDENACNDLLLFPGWQVFEARAEDAYFEYRRRIAQIQRNFGIDDELSLLLCVSGLKTEKFTYMKIESAEVLGIIRMQVVNVFNKLRDTFNKLIPESNSHTARKSLASAWYFTTRRLNQENPNNKYFGLPWIVSSILCEIADENSKSGGDRQHCCTLNEDVIATDLTPKMRRLPPNELKSKVEEVLFTWLKKHLKIFRGFQFIPGNVNVYYKCRLEQIVIKTLDTVMELDAAVERVFRVMSIELKTDDELENMIALAAYITVKRFQRTKLFSSITEISTKNDAQRRTGIFCLSLRNKKFKNYFYRNTDYFQRTLKRSGVQQISISLNEDRFVYVSAFGKGKCLKRLKNALCDHRFCQRLSNYQNWNFY